MRKILFLAIALLGLLGVPSIVAAKAVTVADCYQSIGQTLPSVKERAALAARFGIFFYKGTAEQNKALAPLLCGNNGENIGYAVATGYSKTLRLPISATVTSIPVSSLTLKDGTIVSSSTVGSKIFLDIDPGGAKEEIVLCTDSDPTTLYFTGCTRGLAFSGTSTAAVAGIAYTHNASTPIVMSDVHYVFDQFVDVNNKNQSIDGVKKFIDNSLILGDGTTATTKRFYFCDAATTSTCGYVFAAPSSTSPGTQSLGYSPDGTTTYTFDQGSSGLTASSTKGIGITDSKIHINASSTGGIEFDATTGYTQIKTNSSGGIKTDSTGVSIDPTDSITYTGNNAFSGRLNVSSTNATPSFLVDGITMTSSTVTSTISGGLAVNRISPNPYSSTATTTIVGNIQINGSLDYTGSRYGGTLTAVGTGSQAINTTGNQVITHGLGVIPSTVRIGFATDGKASGAKGGVSGTGFYVSGSQGSVGSTSEVGTGVNASSWVDSSNIIRMKDAAGGDIATGNLSAITTSTFTINWTTNINDGSARVFVWEVSK